MVIALLMVGTSIVTTSPRDQAQAADPLAEAKAQQQALEATLSAQRAALVTLQAKATTHMWALWRASGHTVYSFIAVQHNPRRRTGAGRPMSRRSRILKK